MSGMTINEQDSAGTTVQVTCPSCRVRTKHLVLKAADLSGYDDDAGVSYGASYQIIQCQGCETVSFRASKWDSENIDLDTGIAEEQEELYPERPSRREPLLDGEIFLPASLKRIYDETIAALNGSQPILCGVGVRAIIETVVKDQKAIGDNLIEQIDSLVGAGMLSKPGAEILHKLRTLGN